MVTAKCEHIAMNSVEHRNKYLLLAFMSYIARRTFVFNLARLDVQSRDSVGLNSPKLDAHMMRPQYTNRVFWFEFRFLFEFQFCLPSPPPPNHSICTHIHCFLCFPVIFLKIPFLLSVLLFDSLFICFFI